MTDERLEEIRTVGSVSHADLLVMTAELVREVDRLRRDSAWLDESADRIRAEYRQFVADLGSIVAGQPVEPPEALRRVEQLVRERETR